MARRRQKKRTHLPHPNTVKTPTSTSQPIHASASRLPKTMVIRIGGPDIGPSVSRLVQDTRSMMEPHTAARLRERRSNKLRDYVTMAGPLGVTSLILFSRTEANNVNLRIASHPRGPTVHFRVLEYSTCSDIRRSLKNPKSPGSEFANPPLLVMNNMVSKVPANPDGTPGRIPNHELLLTTMWQNLFPSVSAQRTALGGIRRVLLLNRRVAEKNEDGVLAEDGKNYVIDLRHYAISTKAVGVSRAIRRLNAAEKTVKKSEGKRSKNSLPNLGHLEDIADYLQDPSASGGYTSESEVEEDAQVDMLPSTARKLGGSRKKKRAPKEAEKMKIVLDEMGPRMTLEMVKIEEGMCEGKVLWHAWEKKTREEERALEKKHEIAKRQKQERKKVQKANVERKKAERDERKKKRDERRKRGEKVESDEESEDGEDEEDNYESPDEDGDVDSMSDVEE